MKMTIICLVFSSILISCATKRETAQRVEEKISRQEVKTPEEIKSDINKMLDNHPELSEQAKKKLKKTMDESVEKHLGLKAEESKVIQLLLTKAIHAKTLSAKDWKDKKALKKKLNWIYREKLANIESLIDTITSMSEKKEVSQSFRDDMIFWMGGFR